MKVLIIPGSVRPNSVGNAIIPYVEKELARHEGVEVEVASSEDITLPLLDVPYVPAFSDAEAPHESVKRWSEKVAAADAFVFMVPEYNAGISAVQKNAIDWLYNEWSEKKAAIVTYNFYDKKSAAEAMLTVFGPPKITPVEPIAGLKIGEEVDAEGVVLDEATLEAKLKETISGLVA